MLFVGIFIHIEFKDRTKEVEKIHEDNSIIVAKPTEPKNIKNLENIDFLEEKLEANDDEEDEEKYECEVCFKEIFYDEYELYDGMCEDCFANVHTDENGNYHYEEYWDK